MRSELTMGSRLRPLGEGTPQTAWPPAEKGCVRHAVLSPLQVRRGKAQGQEGEVRAERPSQGWLGAGARLGPRACVWVAAGGFRSAGTSGMPAWGSRPCSSLGLAGSRTRLRIQVPPLSHGMTSAKWKVHNDLGGYGDKPGTA